MAQVTYCKCCGYQTDNTPYCPRCRIEHLEELLGKIQAYLRPNLNQPLSGELSSALFAEDFPTPEQVSTKKQAKKLAAERLAKQIAWLTARNQIADVATQEWEKTHPKPSRADSLLPETYQSDKQRER